MCLITLLNSAVWSQATLILYVHVSHFTMTDVAALQAKIDQLEAENKQLKDDQDQLQQRLDAKQFIKVVPTSQKLRKYGGDSRDLNKWITECKRQISLQGLTGRNACDYILSHLEGHAEDEAQFELDVSTCTSEQIFTALTNAFSEQLTAADLLDLLYQRQQGERESLRDFAYALMRLLDRAVATKQDCVHNKDTLLRDRFILKVRSERLRDHLRTEVWRKPDMKFKEAREEAIRFANEDRKPLKRVTTAGASGGSMLPETRPNLTDDRVLEQMQKQLGQVLDLQKAQGVQIAEQQKLINKLLSGATTKEDKKSGVFCTHCGKQNHVKKNCFKWKALQRKAASESGQDQGAAPPAPQSQGVHSLQQMGQPVPYGYVPVPSQMYGQPQACVPMFHSSQHFPSISGQLGSYQQPPQSATSNPSPDLN